MFPDVSFDCAFVTGGSGFVGRHLIRTLVEQGVEVRALARSESSADIVRDEGAKAVRGDLAATGAMAEGMEKCEVVFHAAAYVDQWGSRETFREVNIRGTENALRAARRAGVGRFVHVGTEAVLAEGQPLVDVDESRPLADDPISLYAWSKGEAEERVREANGEELTTVVVRPRLIWGRGDTSVLPGLVEAIEEGKFAWMSGGEYLTSTCHVENVVEGMLRAAESGQGGEVYFLTDGEDVEFREFVGEMVRSQGVEVPDQSIPLGLAKIAARISEGIWRTFSLSGEPPVTRTATDLLGLQVTVDDSKARQQLGYTAHKSRQEGLEELRAD